MKAADVSATDRADLALSCDRLLGGRVRLLQPTRGYRVAIDPVLLAAATPAGEGDLVLDAGCGTGAAALALATRVSGCRIVGLEIAPELARIARENVRLNGYSARIEIREGDLAAPPADLRTAHFDLVMTNPPYMPPGRGTPPATHAAASIETLPLEAWIRACLRLLRPRGWLVLIHRTGRLAEVLASLSAGCGDVHVFPFWPGAASVEAKRFVVAARKGSGGESHLLRGLVLHDREGGYTPEAEAVLRGGGPLELALRLRGAQAGG